MKPEQSSINPQQLFYRAVGFYQHGDLIEAERLCLQILAIIPFNFPVGHLLGVIRAQQGRNVEALELIDGALKINPNAADATLNYGNVLKALGRHEEALANYDKALAIKPDYVQALSNRGSILFYLKRLDEALASFDEALAIKPDHVEALSSRGVALSNLQRFDEALASYDKALAIKPDYVEALSNRGNTLCEMKRFDEALESLDQALAIKQDFVEALYNHGNALRDLKRFDNALASYDKALAIEPDYAEGLNNRGTVLHDLNRFDEALASYDKALAINPDAAATLYNRGVMQWKEYRYSEAAIADLERVILLAPDYEYARGALLHFRMHGANWHAFEQEAALVDAGVRAGKRIVNPFIYQAISESPADLQACSAILAKHLFPPAPALWKKKRRHRAKIRVGYVSGEFREHATAILTVGLYEAHDKSNFEIFAFDNGWSDGSPTRKRLEVAFDKFIDISNLTGRTAADAILNEEVDILVNLNGYFGLSRMEIFAQRPAPIQVNYLGFPATLGASYIDYIIADRFVIPESERQYYNENVVYLPDTYQANDSQRPVAQTIQTRAENGLPEKAFVFCNFNQSYKLTPAMFAVWMSILRRVAGSVLWILENNTAFPENLRREAESHGVAGSRLVFARRLPMEEHLARLKLADLFLDALPYNAHTTASDALWAGLPLLTCGGKAFPGRVATSLLHAIKLPELVTENLQEYEAMALKLAGNPTLLQALRRKLSHNRQTAPLFDTDRFRRHIESAYTTMWKIFQRGEAPKSFNVEPDG